MLFDLIKMAAPVVLSALADVDSLTNPKKQENPFISATGLTLKNLCEELMDDDDEEEDDDYDTSDNDDIGYYKRKKRREEDFGELLE